MYREVTGYIKENHMIEKGDTVLAGVSGGGDSVTMLYILKEYQNWSLPSVWSMFTTESVVKRQTGIAGSCRNFVQDGRFHAGYTLMMSRH